MVSKIPFLKIHGSKNSWFQKFMVPKIHGSKNSWSGKFHFLKNYWFQTRKFKFKFIGSIIVLGVVCAMWVVCYVISMLILGVLLHKLQHDKK